MCQIKIFLNTLSILFYNLCPRMAWSPSITKIQGRTRTGSKGYCVRKMTPTTKPTYQDDVETRKRGRFISFLPQGVSWDILFPGTFIDIPSYCVRKMMPTTKPTYQDDVETRQGVGS